MAFPVTFHFAEWCHFCQWAKFPTQEHQSTLNKGNHLEQTCFDSLPGSWCGFGPREDVDHNAFESDPWGVIKVKKDRDRRISVSSVGYKPKAKLQAQGLISGSEVTPSGVWAFFCSVKIVFSVIYLRCCLVKAKTSWGVEINLEINKVRGGKERKKNWREIIQKRKKEPKATKRKRKSITVPLRNFLPWWRRHWLLPLK